MTTTTQILHSDCLDAMRALPAESVTAIVTDPPYGLGFMSKGWDKVLPAPEVWREALRVLKPGGHALVFGGTRTYHRLACALEDAGFEIRDCLMWLTGQGFPKNLNVEKAAHEKAQQAAERDVRFMRDTYLSEAVYACRQCSTDSSGRPQTDLCPTDTRSIIAMASRTITALKPSNSQPILSTRDTIRDVIGTIWAAGSSPAELAELTRKSGLDSTDARTASALSAASALFDALSRISEKGRRGNVHSTVKPVDLMRWLVRLVKGPQDNLILDPFAGSGTTGVAAALEDVPCILIEREAQYVEIIRARIAAAQAR